MATPTRPSLCADVRTRACAAAAGSEFFGCTRAHCSRQAHFNSLRALGISESVNVDLTVLTEPNGKEAEGRKEGCQASWVLRDRVLELSPADIRGTLSLKTGPSPHFQQDDDLSPKLWHRATQQRPRDPRLAEPPGWSCTPGRPDGQASAEGDRSGDLASHGAPVLGCGLAGDPPVLCLSLRHVWEACHMLRRTGSHPSAVWFPLI